jgi:glycosyltransferase involved in cell wall biosynthesis
LLWEEFGLSAQMRRRRPHLEVFFGPHYTMPAFSSIPSVVTVHDLTFLEHPEWHQRSKALYFQRALRIACHRAAGIICVSKTTKDHLLAHFDPRGKVFVVPHGLDHLRFSPEEPQLGADAAVLDRLGVRKPFVVHLGTIEPRKDLVNLLRAFERVASKERECSLVLAGERGWGADAFERELSSMSARNRVHVLGYVANSDVAALLRASSVVAYASLDEGFGLPALEALACGATLVTTEHTAMADLAGSAAITIEQGDLQGLVDAIVVGLHEENSASERRELGIAIAAKHSWITSARGHLAAFRAVLDR